MTYGTDAANMLFHVVNDRHRKKRAMIFTTNKALSAWGRVQRRTGTLGHMRRERRCRPRTAKTTTQNIVQPGGPPGMTLRAAPVPWRAKADGPAPCRQPVRGWPFDPISSELLPLTRYPWLPVGAAETAAEAVLSFR